MLEYGKMYRALHRSDKVFRGHSIKAALPTICSLVRMYKPRSLLDYGCGKGRQYTEDKVHEQWGGLMPTLYDVGVDEFSAKPAGPFDGLICTDVLEHIAEEDLHDVLADIFSYLPKRDDGGTSFVALYIACRPAKKKRLPDGRNVHLTVKPPSWWTATIAQHSQQHVAMAVGFDEG
jgi:cyclopropane fatty-acyl-phospholipid synthase-like methyltransferase